MRYPERPYSNTHRGEYGTFTSFGKSSGDGGRSLRSGVLRLESDRGSLFAPLPTSMLPLRKFAGRRFSDLCTVNKKTYKGKKQRTDKQAKPGESHCVLMPIKQSGICGRLDRFTAQHQGTYRNTGLVPPTLCLHGTWRQSIRWLSILFRQRISRDSSVWLSTPARCIIEFESAFNTNPRQWRFYKDRTREGGRLKRKARPN